MRRKEKARLRIPVRRKASENIRPAGQNILHFCVGAARAKKLCDKVCTIPFAGPRCPWVAIGVDAGDANQLAEKIGDGHRFGCLRYQSINFGMPSEIFTRG
jgi:hypothetical protein